MFTLHLSVAQNLSDMRRSTFETDVAWWTKSQSLLQNIYFRLSRFESLLLLYTSATVRIHIHIAPTLHFRDWRGAASLLYKNRAEISLCTEPPPLLRFLLRGGGGGGGGVCTQASRNHRSYAWTAIRYGLLAGVRAIQNNTNIALKIRRI